MSLIDGMSLGPPKCGNRVRLAGPHPQTEVDVDPVECEHRGDAPCPYRYPDGRWAAHYPADGELCAARVPDPPPEAPASTAPTS